MRNIDLPCLIMILILLTGIKSDAQTVRIDENLSLTKVAETPDLIFSITEGEHYISLSSTRNNKIHLYSYMNSGILTKEVAISVPSFAFSAINVDSLLYVADRDSGFIVYDISDKQNSVEIDRLKLGTVEYFNIQNNYAYMYVRGDTLIYVIDISEPKNIDLVAKSDFRFEFQSLTFRDNYLYATTLSNLMTVIDNGDPTHLVKRGFIAPEWGTTLRDIDAVVLNGIYAYVTNNTDKWSVPFSSELHVIDISNINDPIEVNNFRWPDRKAVLKTGLVKAGNYLFVGAGENLLNVFDISDAANPVHLRTVSEFSGYMGDMIYRDNYLYIQTIEDGLTVFKLDIISSIDDDHSAGQSPRTFSLSQNYPNPFNPKTRISFTIPKTGYVHLTIYDLRGRVVKHLVQDQMIAGDHNVEWDGRNEYGNKVASGQYFYTLRVDGKESVTKKMIMLK